MNELPSESLRELSQLYNIEPIQAELINHSVNDTYRVDVRGKHLFLRLYRPNAYFGTEEKAFRFELEFIVHLAKNGVPVPAPIPTQDGRLLASVDVECERHFCAMFPKAPGAPHRAWWPEIRDDEVVRELGSVLAKLHNVAGGFSCAETRYDFDLEFLLEKPLTLLRNAMESHGRQVELAAIDTTFNTARRIVSRLGKDADVYGLIHGDAHVGNVYYDDDFGFTLIDFDHCAYGWRVYDLVPLFHTLELNVPDPRIVERVRALVLEGYEAIRPFSKSEHESIPAFQFLWHLWDIGERLVLSSTWGGPIKHEAETKSSFLDDAVQAIEKAAQWIA